MALSKRTVGILVSLVVSASFISAAFYFTSSLGPNTAGATSTEELLRAYAALDTDGDGLFDWQESLYGADPKNQNSLDPSMTDREAVDSGKVEPKFKSETPTQEDYSGEDVPGIEAAPGTLTDRFARVLFENYLSGNGAGSIPTEDDLVAFVDASVDDLLATNKATTHFGSKDIVKGPKGAEGLRTYAIEAEKAFSENTTYFEKSEILYFSDYIIRGDTVALSHVRTIAESYGKIAYAFVHTPVPEEAVAAHVRMANAMARMSDVIGDMGQVDTDPMLGLVGLNSYDEAVAELSFSFRDMYAIFANQGIVLTTGDAGHFFYHATETINALPQSTP